MSKDEIQERQRKLLHSIVMATSEEEVDQLLSETETFLAKYSKSLGSKEYSDSLQALRVFSWKAKHKLQEGI